MIYHRKQYAKKFRSMQYAIQIIAIRIQVQCSLRVIAACGFYACIVA